MTMFAGFRLVRTRSGVPVLWRSDPRFKTFRVEFHARRPLDERAAARSVLPSLLLQGTRSEPDRPALARRMEALFGAAVMPGSYKRGCAHALQMSLDAVSGGFLPGQPDQFGEGLALLAEQLAHPRLDASGTAFPEAAFELERREAVDAVRALKDDKGSWAQVRAMRTLCADEPFAVPEYGSLEALQALTPSDPEAARRDFLARGRLHMVATGALPDETALLDKVEAFLDDALGGSVEGARTEEELPTVAGATRPSEVRHVVETADGMQQAKLVMVFRVDGMTEVHDDGPELMQRDMARRLFNTVYGGGPQSRLFREVREKRSLAYYAQSGLDRHTGLLQVQVGCDAEQAGAVEAACLEELTRVQSGEFDDQDLDTARAQVASRLTRVDESLAARAGFTNDAWALGLDRTPEQLGEALARADRDGVVEAASRVWLDGVYLLRQAAADGDAGTPTKEEEA